MPRRARAVSYASCRARGRTATMDLGAVGRGRRRGTLGVEDAPFGPVIDVELAEPVEVAGEFSAEQLGGDDVLELGEGQVADVARGGEKVGQGTGIEAETERRWLAGHEPASPCSVAVVGVAASARERAEGARSGQQPVGGPVRVGHARGQRTARGPDRRHGVGEEIPVPHEEAA